MVEEKKKKFAIDHHAASDLFFSQGLARALFLCLYDEGGEGMDSILKSLTTGPPTLQPVSLTVNFLHLSYHQLLIAFDFPSSRTACERQLPGQCP